MKDKYRKKVWWNLWHLVIIVLGLLIWLGISYNSYNSILIDKGVKPPFFDYLFADPYVVLTFGLIFLVVSYLIATFISWLYYNNKR